MFAKEHNRHGKDALQQALYGQRPSGSNDYVTVTVTVVSRFNFKLNLKRLGLGLKLIVHFKSHTFSTCTYYSHTEQRTCSHQLEHDSMIVTTRLCFSGCQWPGPFHFVDTGMIMVILSTHLGTNLMSLDRPLWSPRYTLTNTAVEP